MLRQIRKCTPGCASDWCSTTFHIMHGIYTPTVQLCIWLDLRRGVFVFFCYVLQTWSHTRRVNCLGGRGTDTWVVPGLSDSSPPPFTAPKPPPSSCNTLTSDMVYDVLPRRTVRVCYVRRSVRNPLPKAFLHDSARRAAGASTCSGFWWRSSWGLIVTKQLKEVTLPAVITMCSDCQRMLAEGFQHTAGAAVRAHARLRRHTHTLTHNLFFSPDQPAAPLAFSTVSFLQSLVAWCTGPPPSFTIIASNLPCKGSFEFGRPHTEI